MKVGMDISQVAYSGGVATYTNNLAYKLQGEIDIAFFYTSLRNSYKGGLRNVKEFKMPISIAEILFNRLRLLPVDLFIGDVDIFHSSDWIQPPTKAKKVTTYHDLVPLKYPQWSDPEIVEVNKRRIGLVEQEIDAVIVVSNSTKKDLLEVSDISESKVHVVYEGVGEHFKVQDDRQIAEFKKKYDLPDEYILAIGGVGERKNLKRIKEASEGRNLLVTGENIPYLKDDELPVLYAGASVLLYPSLYEGFGLPIIEAMACGTPVITSNVSSMPEIAGEAGLFVDPTNVKDIKDKLEIILSDTSLREKQVKMGFIQSKKFNWDKCAEQTIQVYQSLDV